MEQTSKHGILPLLLALSLAACGGEDKDGGGARANAPAAAPPVSVEAEVVKSGPLAQELVAVGSVRSDESVTLRSEIAGRLARIGFQEGQEVKAGQVLFELDDSVFRAELDQAHANERLTRRNHDRAQELWAQKLISASDRDNAAANHDVARAALALAQARAAKTRIAAPFTGIVGLRMVSPGDYVAAGQELVNLEAMNPIKIDFRLSEAALPSLAVGQPLDIEVDAYPGRTFRGEVYAIDPRVADATRSIALRARLQNDDGKLRPGLFARVRLQVSHKPSALLIPEQAIFPRGEQQFAYVVENGKAAIRELKIGQRVPGRVEVLSGIQEGDRVITAGVQKIGPGAAVTVAGDSPQP